MERQPIQIYLTTEQYSVLREAAVSFGKPMTAVVRDLIQTHLVEHTPPPTDLTDLLGTVDLGYETDVAADKHRMIEEAILAEASGHR